MEIFNLNCPSCNNRLRWQLPENDPNILYKAFCENCYVPLLFDKTKMKVSIRKESIRTHCYFAHSWDSKDEGIVNYFQQILYAFGVESYFVEEDNRPISNEQKIEEGINNSDFFFGLFTKKHSHELKNGELVWTAPEGVRDETMKAISARKSTLILVEKGVRIEGLLPYEVYFYYFERKEKLVPLIPNNFLNSIDNMIDYVQKEKAKNLILGIAFTLVLLGVAYLVLRHED